DRPRPTGSVILHISARKKSHRRQRARHANLEHLHARVFTLDRIFRERKVVNPTLTPTYARTDRRFGMEERGEHYGVERSAGGCLVKMLATVQFGCCTVCFGSAALRAFIRM